MPQGKVRFIVTTAPKRPIRPKPRLRLVYSGPPIVSSADDVLAIIRARCTDVLTDAELALIVRVPAIEGPKPAKPAGSRKPPAKKAKRRAKARP